MAKKILFELRERSADPAFQVVEDDNGEIQTHYGATYNSEANLRVGVTAQTDVSGATVLVGAGGEVYKPLLAGIIRIAMPTVDGADTSAAQVVNSQTVTAGMSGEKLLYSTVVRDDFGGMAASIITNPGHIYVPEGVKYIELSASVTFPGEATGAGIRWARLINGASTHKGNMSRAAVPVVPNAVFVQGGLFEAPAGADFWVGAIHDLGSPLTLSIGSINNDYGSNWFQAKFYR